MGKVEGVGRGWAEKKEVKEEVCCCSWRGGGKGEEG